MTNQMDIFFWPIRSHLLTNQRPNYFWIAGEDHSRGGHCSCARVCLWLRWGEIFPNWKKSSFHRLLQTFCTNVHFLKRICRKVWSFDNVVLYSVKVFPWVFDTFKSIYRANVCVFNRFWTFTKYVQWPVHCSLLWVCEEPL